MGYYSSIWGDIEFDPPAAWEEIRAAGDNLFKLEIKTEEEERPEGTLMKRTARRIVTAYDDRVKAYNAEADLQAIVDAIPGRSFSGEFRISGEESGDVQRLFVTDEGKVVLWKARLLWPDGSSEPGR